MTKKKIENTDFEVFGHAIKMEKRGSILTKTITEAQGEFEYNITTRSFV